MPTPTLYMGLPNPTPFGDSGTWANEIVTCNTGFDTLAVSNFVAVSVTGSLSVFNGPALVQATGGSLGITLTLPDVTNGGLNATNEGRVYVIVKVDSGVGVITINPFSGGQTISGQSSLTITNQWHGRTLQSTATGWVIIGILDESVTGIVPVADGGTGANLTSTGGTSQVLLQATTGANITVRQLAASDLSNGTTGTGAVVLANAPTFAVNPTFASFTGSGGVVLATSPTISAATLTGSVTISGTASYTTANPMFFSAQGTGGKVQLSTGTTVTGDVVTYDATGNTIDSGVLLTSLAPKASPTFTGAVTISGTATYTTANPTFFSATGTGAVVLATSPALTTPNIGAASGTSLATTAFVSVGSTITSYNGLTTAGQGVAPIVTWAASTPTTPVGSTPILASAPAGLYKLTYYSVVTTTGTVGTDFKFNLFYTDAFGAQTPILFTNSTFTAGDVNQGSFVIQNQSPNDIAYSITEDGAFTIHPVLALQIILERLN